MSALGQKQTLCDVRGMSALPPKADMCSATRDVRFVRIADFRCQLSVCQLPYRRTRTSRRILHCRPQVHQASVL